MSAPGQTHGGVFTAMSSSHRSDGPALVALGLLLIAVVLVAPLPLLERGARTANQQVAQSADDQEVGGQPPVAQESIGWRLLDPYAQWLMASFAAFATGASVVGIVLLRRTFEETEKTAKAAVRANEIAHEIAYTQVRAYLGVSEISASIQGDFLNGEVVVDVRIGNGGQTPARNISFRGYLVFVGEDAKVRALHISTDADPSDIYGGTSRRVFNCRAKLSAVEIAAIEKHGGGFKLAGTVWYTPVVGQRRHFLRYAYALLPNQSLLQDRQLRTIRGERGNDAN